MTPTRSLYTFVGANPGTPVDLTSNANYSVLTTNPLLTNTLLGVTSTATHDKVINFARGEDVKDQDGDGNVLEPRHEMGDPLHAQPAVVIYGGTPGAPTVTDAAVFAPTNDGFLHAIDVNDGHELWAFIPQELLPNLKQTYSNNPAGTKNYMLGRLGARAQVRCQRRRRDRCRGR